MFNVGDVVVFTPEAKIVYNDWPGKNWEFKVSSVHGNSISFYHSGAEKNDFGYNIYSLDKGNFQYAKPKVLVEVEDML
jgi:hypothetical protein